MAEKNVFDWIAAILVIIGGLNWGFVGIFNFNFVGWVFGAMSVVSRIVYIVVAAGALWMIWWLVRKNE